MRGDGVLVEGEQDRLGLDAFDPEAQQVRELARPEAFDAVNGERRRGRPVDQGALPCRFRREIEVFERRTETDDRRNVLDAGPPRPLLSAAEQQRSDSQPAANQQCSDALRAAELVRRDRAEIGAEVGEGEADVTDRRARVNMQEHPSGTIDRERLQCADLVVRELDRHELGGVSDGGGEVAAIDAAHAIDSDDGDVGRCAGDRLPYRGVLDRGRDGMTPHPVVRMIDGFGPSGGEHDLSGSGADEGGDLLARDLDRDPRHPCLRVYAAGVRVVLGEVGEHRVEGGLAQRCRRRVIEICASDVHTRSDVSDTRDAVHVAAGPALGDRRLRLAVQPFEHPANHSGVDSTEHVRVLLGSFPEGAVLVDELQAPVARLCMRCEAMRGQSICNGGNRGLERPLTFARIHAVRDRAAVLVPDFLREVVRLGRGQTIERSGEQHAEQVIAARREREVGVGGRCAVHLRRPSGRLVLGELDVHVAAGCQLLQVVARNVGVQIELDGHLGGAHAVVVAHVQVDPAPGGIAERARDRGDRGGELVAREHLARERLARVRLGAARFRWGREIPGRWSGEIRRRWSGVRDGHRRILPTRVVKIAAATRAVREGLPSSVYAGEGTAVSNPFTDSSTRILAIASGKGGVGKSSVTTNLAVALARRGARVAAVDADVWGFSMPRMLGITDPPQVTEPPEGAAQSERPLMIPPEANGVALISMGFFARDDQPVVWRGPMLHKALEQFLTDVQWGERDYLIVDMPPGTGDVSLSIAQFLPRAEVIVVTTPQPAAQKVAQRAAYMAKKVNLAIAGVIENMTWFRGDDGKAYELFGAGGGQELADDLDVPLLGQIPLVPALREGGDAGRPIVVSDPDGEAALAFTRIAERIHVELAPKRIYRPELRIS